MKKINLGISDLKSQKGFTLIEVLIVVVIIGVLAALIVPRMTGQMEKAKVAEATQMLSVMIRGYLREMDLRGEEPETATVGVFDCRDKEICEDPVLATLGLKSFKQKDFRYTCSKWPFPPQYGYFCRAFRQLTVDSAQPYMYLCSNYVPGQFFCAAGYVSDAGVQGYTTSGKVCTPDF